MSELEAWTQEDFCQVLNVPSAHKYESQGGPGIRDIMSCLLGSANADHDRRNFMKAQVLFWLLAATDGHAKNFSVFIEDGGSFRLAPLSKKRRKTPGFSPGIRSKNRADPDHASPEA